jgi:hypothetical protein
MKRTLLTLAIMAAVAGTAAAQTSPAPGNQPSAPTPSTGMGDGGATGGKGEGASTNNTAMPAPASPDGANTNDETTNNAAMTAKRAIEQDGYKNVRELAKGSDGLWHAQAMRGNTQVQVTVNRSGRVSAQ